MEKAHQSTRRLASTGIFCAQIQIFWPSVANFRKLDYCFDYCLHRFSTSINSTIVFCKLCKIDFFHYFMSTTFCLTVPEKFVRQRFSVSQKSGIENFVNELGGLSRCTVVLINKNVGKVWDPSPYPALQNTVVLLTVLWEQSELLTRQWSHWTYSLIEIRTGTCCLTNFFTTRCRGSFFILSG